MSHGTSVVFTFGGGGARVALHVLHMNESCLTYKWVMGALSVIPANSLCQDL